MFLSNYLCRCQLKNCVSSCFGLSEPYSAIYSATKWMPVFIPKNVGIMSFRQFLGIVISYAAPLVIVEDFRIMLDDSKIGMKFISLQMIVKFMFSMSLLHQLIQFLFA